MFNTKIKKTTKYGMEGVPMFNTEIDESIDIPLTKPQADFVMDQARIVVGSGGVGCGKTVGAMLKVALYVLRNPGVVFLCVARTHKQVTNVLMRELDEHAYRLQMNYKLDKQKSEITVFTRPQASKIIFSTMVSEANIKGLSVGGAYIDEVTECKQGFLERVKNNLRQKNMPNQLILTTNPATTQHYFYRRYIDEKNRPPFLSVHFFKTMDNHFLDDNYIENMEHIRKTRPQYYEIQYDGKWTNSKGLIYSELKDSNFATAPIDLTSFKEFIMGVDFGYSAPYAHVLLGVRDGQLTAISEFKQSHFKLEDQVLALTNLRHKLQDANPAASLTIYCDSNAPAYVEEFRRQNLPAVSVEKGKDSVRLGIAKVRDFLYTDNLLIHKDLTQLTDELYSYRYQIAKGYEDDVMVGDSVFTEEPAKINDHLADALRYAIYGRYGGEATWTATDIGSYFK